MTTLEGDWTYHYDLAGQLTSVTLPNGRSIDYVYDAAGNRVSVTDNGQKADYSTTNLNQYVTIGTAIYSYDADGNLVSKTDGSNTWTYTYDDQNRFIGLAGPDGTWAFRYDTFGNRVGAVHNGQQTEYLIDPFGLGNVVAEYDSTGSAVAHYTHGLNLVSRIDPTDGSAYYLFDGNGNTAQLIGPQGNVLNSYNYLPFGEPLNRAETVPNPFTFAGQYGVTNETKDLYFMRNRWYDPQQGRFVQPDPIDIAGGDVDLYRYVMNDPVNLVDPRGLFPFFCVSIEFCLEESAPIPPEVLRPTPIEHYITRPPGKPGPPPNFGERPPTFSEEAGDIIDSGWVEIFLPLRPRTFA